jgi:uncharacterized protein YllA (UPF0747 family)
MPEELEDELIPVHIVAYEDSADLDIDETNAGPTVENHDELIKAGKAFDEVRAMNRSDAEEYNLDIVERGDVLWREKFEDLESGDAWRLDELE